MLHQEVSMATERRVRIFRNGRKHAVGIPREFELPGDEAIVRREGASDHRARVTRIADCTTGDAEPIEEDLEVAPDRPPEPADL
jgi:antitoxin VapB